MSEETTQVRVADDLLFDVSVAGPAEGLPVILLHGFPQTSASWTSVMSGLADAGYRAIAPDQRGYSPGARPIDPAAYRSDHLVADVLAIADHFGADRFHVVGHDWGGALAWQLGGRHADRLRTLTAVSTPHPGAFGRALSGELGGDQGERSGYMAFFSQPGAEHQMLDHDAALLRQLYQASGLPDELAARHLERLATPEALGAALNWYRAADATLIEGFGPITTPTLYVWSTDDVALGREAAEATGAFVEGPYRFEVLEGVGHWIPELAHTDLNRLLLEHLPTA